MRRRPSLPSWVPGIVQGVMIGVIVAAITVPLTLYETGFFEHQNARHIAPKAGLTFDNTEIVVDASADMTEPFDGGTKLTEAAAEINHFTGLRESDSLALRSFGGVCTPGSRLLVPFRTQNAARIARALDGVRAGGPNTLVAGLIEATGDFENVSKMPLRLAARIVVVLGGFDACDHHALADISQRMNELRRRHIAIEFWYIGMSVSQTDRRSVLAIAKVTGGNVQFASAPTELQQALDVALRQAPVAKAAKVWADSNAALAAKFKVLLGRVTSTHPRSAVSLSNAIRQELSKTEGSYQLLIRPTTRSAFPSVAALAAGLHRASAQQLSLVPRIVLLQRAVRSGSTTARPKLAKAILAFQDSYGTYIQDSQALTLAGKQLIPGQ